MVWIAALYQALLTLEELLLCGTAFGEFLCHRSTTSSRSAPGLIIIPSCCFWHTAPTVTSTLYFILFYLYFAWRSYEQSGLTSSPRSYYWLTTNLCKFSTCHLPGTVLRRRNLYKLMTNCLPLVYHLFTTCLPPIVPL